MRKTIASLFSLLFLLLPMQAWALQYDGIKNLTTSTRTYTLTNPATSISIGPGQVVIIQDSQFQASTQLQADVQSGYVSEYPIGSPNSTQTIYAQPVQIQSSSNSVAGLSIQESSGSEPGISVTQNNSADIVDFYQSAALEFGLNNALLTVNPNAVFNNALTIGASSTAGGLLQFGSGSSARLQYSTSAGTYPANTFGFSQSISTSAYQGYSIGTLPVLYQDNSFTNTTVDTGTAGVLYFAQNGTAWAQLKPSYGFQIIGGSSYGANANITGNLNVAGNTAFNALAATVLTANAITSPSNSNVLIYPSNGNYIQLTDHTQTITFAQFNDNGTYILGNGFVTGSGSLFSVPTVTTSSIVFPTGTLSNGSTGTQYKITNSADNFTIQSAANVVIAKFNNDGSGQLNSGITFNAAGGLTATALTAPTMSGATLALTGNETAADIYASRTANTGALFLGTNGTHYIYYDGTNYNMPAGNIVLGGTLNATAIVDTGNLTLPATSTLFFGSGNTIAATTNSLTFSQGLIDHSATPTDIDLLDSTNIVTPLLQSGADLNLRTPSNLNIAANQINITTAGTIAMGASYYGNTTASVSGSIYTPVINSGQLAWNNGITINANSGANGLAIESNRVVMENQQPLTFAGSTASYGLNAVIPGTLEVDGALNAYVTTVDDLNNTPHKNATMTVGTITLDGNGHYTLNVPGNVHSMTMTPIDPTELNSLIPCIVSMSGGSLTVGAHFSNNGGVIASNTTWTITVISY